VKKKHFIFIIQNNNKNKKLKSFLKELKHEPSLKKPEDFTVAKGHRYLLVHYGCHRLFHKVYKSTCFEMFSETKSSMIFVWGITQFGTPFEIIFYNGT